MTKITWDGTGEKRFENGVSNGVLYPRNNTTGLYPLGVAWNGLTTVTEAPTGGTENKQYADNQLYASLVSNEIFAGTIDAFTYPDEFEPCDGSYVPESGLTVGQQERLRFGLCYRTEIGNDVNSSVGFKLHLVYGLLAAPSQKAHATINDSPAALQLSWNVTSNPVPVTGKKPTSTLTLDSTKVDATALATLEDMLYGTSGQDPYLPMPDDVLALFAGTITTVTPTIPTFSADTITIPTVTGVDYRINGEIVAAGPVAITQDTVVTATPKSGYDFPPAFDNDWEYIHT